MVPTTQGVNGVVFLFDHRLPRQGFPLVVSLFGLALYLYQVLLCLRYVSPDESSSALVALPLFQTGASVGT